MKLGLYFTVLLLQEHSHELVQGRHANLSYCRICYKEETPPCGIIQYCSIFT